MTKIKKAIKKKKAKIIRTDFNSELFGALVEVRDSIANKRSVANFIIFNDNVLKEMAYFYPMNRKEFLSIKGVGENKFNEFGEKFSSIINEFEIEDSELTKKHEELKKSVEMKPKINVKERTELRKQRVKELILKKTSIEDIAQNLELTNQTIVNYIGRLLADNSSLDVEYIKENVEGYNDIVKSFDKHGTEKIGPVYGDFAGMVEYSDIILVKTLLLAK